MFSVGVIGYGYWGPNLVRNFSGLANADVLMICDANQKARDKASRAYPRMDVVSDSTELIDSSKIDAVVIATPVSTHFELVKKALEAGKHVFVEKPFTETVAQGEALVELAERKKLVLMVDHTFLFTGAVRKIKELIDTEALGRIYYFDSMRVNLGLFQHDVNVVWDLAPHDLSIMDYLLTNKPIGISANGIAHFGNGLHNIAYITVYFQDNLIAHFNVNWLSPVKVRSTLIGGEKKMLTWNDLEADEKIKVYDKGVDVKTGEGIRKILVSYRSGDMWSPRLEQTEALKEEAEYFVKCVEENKVPFNDGHSGLRVVRLLEASTESLKSEGKIIKI